MTDVNKLRSRFRFQQGVAFSEATIKDFESVPKPHPPTNPRMTTITEPDGVRVMRGASMFELNEEDMASDEAWERGMERGRKHQEEVMAEAERTNAGVVIVTAPPVLPPYHPQSKDGLTVEVMQLLADDLWLTAKIISIDYDHMTYRWINEDGEERVDQIETFFRDIADVIQDNRS